MDRGACDPSSSSSSSSSSSGSYGAPLGAAVVLSLAAFVAHRCHKRANPSSPVLATCMRGKTAIVTGANTGLGRETARQLAGMGAHVVLACRDVSKGQRAAEDIARHMGPGGAVEVAELDLASPDSIAAFCRAWQGGERPCHVLVNNAATMSPHHGTARSASSSVEATFAVNHLGPFALTLGLLPSLVATGTPATPARVVNVSSRLEKRGSLDFEGADAHSRQGKYHMFQAYSTSKLANLLFSFELDRRVGQVPGAHVHTNAVTPGMVPGTDLGRWTNPLLRLVARPLVFMLFPSPAEAALAVTWAASAPELEHIGGGFYGDLAAAQCSDKAKDKAAAQELWALSERLTGLTFEEAVAKTGPVSPPVELR